MGYHIITSSDSCNFITKTRKWSFDLWLTSLLKSYILIIYLVVTTIFKGWEDVKIRGVEWEN